jgi:glycosyltransferase involved in cell wall biosynthesis
MTGPADILLIGPWPEPRGGISIHLQRLRARLDAAGLSSALLDTSEVYKPDLPNLRRDGLAKAWAMIGQARVVHIHVMNAYVRLVLLAMARARGKKAVFTFHGMPLSTQESLLVRAAKAVTHEAVWVNTAQREIFGHGPVVPAFLAPTPDEETLPDDITAWIGRQRAAGRKIIAGNAFRVHEAPGGDIYGVDLLIEAFRRPEIAQRFACLFVIASTAKSDPAMYARYADAAEALGMGDHFWLRPDPINFSGLMKLSDALVRPTRTDGDSLSIREALHYGKAAITSDATPRPQGAAVFRTGDSADLAQTILAAFAAAPPAPPVQDYSDTLMTLYRRFSAKAA